MLIWKLGVLVTLQSFSNGHINVVLSHPQDSGWRLTSFHGYPQQDQRRSSWTLLQ